MRIEPYERETTWLRAMKLVAMMYRLTHEYPQEEKAGLAAAVRRSVTAIPAKLADAHGQPEAEQANASFTAAQALLRELQTHLQISYQLGIITRWRLGRLRTKCQKLEDLIEACKSPASPDAGASHTLHKAA